MCRGKKKANKPWNLLIRQDAFAGGPPNVQSCLTSGLLFLLLLTASEQSFRFFLSSIQQLHPLLEVNHHRCIVARYVGVDALCCVIVSIAGWRARHIWFSSKPPATTISGYDHRLYAYHAAAFRVAFFFFCYQVKDLFDSVIWNDKPELIVHHALSLISAWGCLSTGTGLYYAPFFFGLSEVSTAALCCLVNFEDERGVPGLGDAFPMIKVSVGLLFMLLFVGCRGILWPLFSYYLCRDVLKALEVNDSRTQARRGWLYFFLVSLSCLSVLQVAWLGQMVVVARHELGKALLV